MAACETSAPPLTAAEPARARVPRWAWPIGLTVVTVVLFVCYVRLSGTIPDNSDGSDQALQAWDVLHGNWLLRGWTVGDVSYYTTEIPEYMIVEKIIGLGANVIHVAAGLTYTLLVLLAGWLAKGRATGREGVVRALIASGILLAPQPGHGVHLLIQQPDHIGTQVPLLAVLIVLDRGPRRWYLPAAVMLMLTWVIVSDRVGMFTAALPLAAVCGLRVLWAVGRERRRLASMWFESWLAAAGIFSFVLATLIVAVIKHLGGYTPLPLPSKVTSVGALPAHVVLTGEGILNLYGADVIRMPAGAAFAVALVHLAGLALALAGFCLACRRFLSATDLILPVLATGIVVQPGRLHLQHRPRHLVRHQGNHRRTAARRGARGPPAGRAAHPGAAAAGAGGAARRATRPPSDTAPRNPRWPTTSGLSSAGSRPTTWSPGSAPTPRPTSSRSTAAAAPRSGRSPGAAQAPSRARMSRRRRGTTRGKTTPTSW